MRLCYKLSKLAPSDILPPAPPLPPCSTTFPNGRSSTGDQVLKCMSYGGHFSFRPQQCPVFVSLGMLTPISRLCNANTEPQLVSHPYSGRGEHLKSTLSIGEKNLAVKRTLKGLASLETKLSALPFLGVLPRP